MVGMEVGPDWLLLILPCRILFLWHLDTRSSIPQALDLGTTDSTQFWCTDISKTFLSPPSVFFLYPSIFSFSLYLCLTLFLSPSVSPSVCMSMCLPNKTIHVSLYLSSVYLSWFIIVPIFNLNSYL